MLKLVGRPTKASEEKEKPLSRDRKDLLGVGKSVGGREGVVRAQEFQREG